jgi:hypothetical protein
MGRQRSGHRPPEGLVLLLMRATRRKIGAVGAALLAAGALLGAGCSSSSEHAVFAVATGQSTSATARTTDLVDLGVPDLYNQNGQTVTLRGVSLVTTPRSVHLRMVTAYLHSQTGVHQLGYAYGDFLKHCRHQMTPYPVSSVVVPPHSYAKWFLVLSVTFARPGRYYLGRVRIDYTTGGQDGWQYQNIHYTMIITLHNRKLPAFAGCL